MVRRKEVESAAAVGLLNAQSTSALSSGFPLLQGNAEAITTFSSMTSRLVNRCPFMD